MIKVELSTKNGVTAGYASASGSPNDIIRDLAACVDGIIRYMAKDGPDDIPYDAYMALLVHSIMNVREAQDRGSNNVHSLSKQDVNEILKQYVKMEGAAE